MGWDFIRNIDLSPSGNRSGFRLMFAFAVFAAIQGVVIFLVGTAAAIFEHNGYSISRDYLSNLGRQSFEFSHYFNYTLTWLGFSLIPMFLMIWITDPRQSFSAKLTAILGIVSAAGLIGLGMSPVDRYYITHHVWLAIWIFPMFYMTVSFFYVAARSPYVGVGFVGASLVMVVGMITYLSMVELTTYELLQKAIVVCGLIWLCYMIAFIWQSGFKVLKGWKIDDDSKARKEAAYMSTLKFRDYRAD